MTSSQPSFQPSFPETKPLPISNRPVPGPGLSAPIPVRPLLLRSSHPRESQPPTAAEHNQLLAAITQRDLAILSALHHYRYLDRGQVQALFFPSPRSSQLRLRWLCDQHLLIRWLALQPPGWHRRDSVFLLSPRGAGLLAASLNQDPRPYVRRSFHARDHAFHLVHDLESNGFLIHLAAASQPWPQEGLYHWVGEEACRQLYRERGARIAPDAWGRYLTPHGEITFFLEWDRGTESAARLGRKLDGYLQHFSGRRQADLNNILFVLPGAAREETLRALIAERTSQNPGPRCQLWTATLDRLHERGPRGRIWLSAGVGSIQLSLPNLPAHPRTDRHVEGCIGKAGWWAWRRGGGEGA